MSDQQILTMLWTVNPQIFLGSFLFDETLQPGMSIEHLGQRYCVLERRHRYRLEMGRYQLASAVLYVLPNAAENETLHVGDLNCRFNARSPLIRCAVRPHGPCEGCSEFEPREAVP